MAKSSHLLNKFAWTIARINFALILFFNSPAFAKNAHKPDGATLCMALEPSVLDPTLAPGQNVREIVYANIFEGLTGIDRDGKIVPRLAESWNISADGLHYIFKLRETAAFHDGTPFTAEDVKFTFARAMAGDSKNIEKWIFDPIKSVEVRDAHTVEITLSYASSLFLYGLGWADAVIASEKTASQNVTQPVGTGPYKFKSWQRGDKLTVERNDAWWGGKAPLARVAYRFVNDPQASISAIQTGDCDLISAGAPPEMIETLRKNPQLTVTIGETEAEVMLAINNARPPFNDVRVRRALAHAINRKAVIDGAMSGYATPIGSHFSPTHPAYVDLTDISLYDPAKARELLAAAGYQAGFAATLIVPPLTYTRRSAEIIAEQLKAVGVNVTLVPLEFPQWLERVYKNKDYDFSLVTHTQPFDITLYAQPDNYFQYKSEAFQTLIKKIYRAASENERNALLAEAQKILANDAVNVFLFELPKITVARKDLTGVWLNWPMPVTPLSELAWKQDK
jgi:peptide/nickel transport system substrate-binding protein